MTRVPTPAPTPRPFPDLTQQTPPPLPQVLIDLGLLPADSVVTVHTVHLEQRLVEVHYADRCKYAPRAARPHQATAAALADDLAHGGIEGAPTTCFHCCQPHHQQLVGDLDAAVGTVIDWVANMHLSTAPLAQMRHLRAARLLTPEETGIPHVDTYRAAWGAHLADAEQQVAASSGYREQLLQTLLLGYERWCGNDTGVSVRDTVEIRRLVAAAPLPPTRPDDPGTVEDELARLASAWVWVDLTTTGHYEAPLAYADRVDLEHPRVVRIPAAAAFCLPEGPDGLLCLDEGDTHAAVAAAVAVAADGVDLRALLAALAAAT